MTYEIKETLVTVKDVTLKFGEALILKPITIEVKNITRPGLDQGQVIGILGPSGSGKTQFSRILSGLQAPTTGSVHIHSQTEDGAFKDTPVQAGQVGMVFQNYPLFVHRTILGNLILALEGTKLSQKERREKALSYLEKFELADKAMLYPAQLSGGQRQRVSIIQELLGAGHYLILDEPFTGLDPVMKDKVCDLINFVATLDERNTIFVVAHDISALASIADTLWLFGRDRTEANEVIPGAYIKKTYDLMSLGLAWRPGISRTPEFHSLVDDIKEQFHHL